MNAERSLLLGLLAFQNGFITQAQLLKAFGAWVADKSKGLNDYLVVQGALKVDAADVLEKMVDLHLVRFGGDASQSLASLSAGSSIRAELERLALGDAEALRSLSILPIPNSAKRRPKSSGNQADPNDRSEYATESPAGKADSSVQFSSGSSNRFRIVKEHAKGGLGVVFVAEDRELHREVALKQIREDRIDFEEYRAKFTQEAEVTGQLEHPGIVPVYALGTDETGRPYYAMRFIKGEDLQTRLRSFHKERKEKRLQLDGPELRGLLRRFIDVGNAIDYAHDRGVLHRDLKPGNVMLGKHGETLVVDWGLAKTLGQKPGIDPMATIGQTSELPIPRSGSSGDSETRQGTFIGTPAYAPPEQVLGDLERLGPPSDVYSLGAILYELLTGKVPISGSTIEEIKAKSTTGNYPSQRSLDSEIPKPLEAICRKAMSVKIEDRYSTAIALRSDIERWLDDSPVAVYAEPITARFRRWMRRNPAIASSIAASLILGFVAAVGYGTIASSHNRILDLYRSTNELDQSGDDLRSFEWHYWNRLCHSELLELKGHAGFVRSVIYAPDGKTLATSSADRTVRLWDAESGRELLKLRGSLIEWSFGEATSVAFSPDGKRLASASVDKTAKVWDSTSGRELLSLNGHSGTVLDVRFSPDGKQLATSSTDGTLKLWDAENSRELLTLKGHTGWINSVAFSPDGKRLASASNVRTAKVWDSTNGRELFSLEGHTGAVTGVAFSPDGKQLATSSAEMTLKLWDAASGKEMLTLKGHASMIRCVSFSPDGKRLASTCTDGTVKLWDAESGQETLSLKDYTRLWGFEDMVFSSDGKWMATSGGGRVIIWGALQQEADAAAMAARKAD